MSRQKRCTRCQVTFDEQHWAFSRENCPTCGNGLQEVDQTVPTLAYDHYDSSTDIQFDLAGLLTPEQRGETRMIGLIGIGLILIAFLARVLFVVLGRVDGFWSVPGWFDGLVAVMLLLGCSALVWSGHQWIRHLLAKRRR